MTEFIQVSTTVNSKEGADKIARKLLDERLASCVQVLGPIHSNYWWKGKIERARFLRFQIYAEISTISTGLEPKQPASQSPRKQGKELDYEQLVRLTRDHSAFFLQLSTQVCRQNFQPGFSHLSLSYQLKHSVDVVTRPVLALPGCETDKTSCCIQGSDSTINPSEAKSFF